MFRYQLAKKSADMHSFVDGTLTLVVVVLVVGSPIEHSEDLENVAVGIISMELIPGAVKAENQLLDASAFLPALSRSRSTRGRALSSSPTVSRKPIGFLGLALLRGAWVQALASHDFRDGSSRASLKN